MKFIVDAHLPLALKSWLKQQGHDAVHTRDLQQHSVVEMSNSKILVHF
jgi:predicted nuclease of predicted toxin-antitoxin system